MGQRWMVNISPFLHFDNARTHTYEHNISIVAWNVKSVLDFLEVDPSHKFCLDQVTLLEGFERLFPNYWDSLHQRVLEGRIEIVGGTYVMPDLIIPDGESIVRQFLYGMKYFREKLGVNVKTGWAIDSSGHCAQMPQILRLCGIDSYFFWRGMPFKSPTEFVWKGPDGSRVNAIWLSRGFDSAAWLSENTREAFTKLLDIVETTGEIAASNNVFVPVGGELVPPLPHLVNVVDTWNKTFADMKMVVATPREFTDKMKSVQANMPLITGELNTGRFTGNRTGTLSARVRLKILNRKLETLLYLTELYGSLSGISGMQGELDNIWRMLLFNQDHNIIRGVSSDEPYKFAIRRYNQAMKMSEKLLEKSVEQLALSIGRQSALPSFAVFNPLPWKRSDIVQIMIDTSSIDTSYFEIHDSRGNSIPFQMIDDAQDSDSTQILIIAKDVPSLGYGVYTVAPCIEKPEFETSLKTGTNWMESDEFILEFEDFSGAILRFYDKRGQFEVLRSSGNYITMESDVGDIYRHAPSDLSSSSSIITSLRFSGKLELVESGPVRSVMEITGEIMGSTRTQRVVMYEGIHRIDLETGLDFKGQDKRVRLGFPLSVFSSTVTVGAQFGTEVRHVNLEESTDWVDPLKGQFSALDWVDCAGPEVGICISSIGLHEFEFKDGLFQTTLIRSVDHMSRGLDDDVIETPTARDNGPHSFSFTIFPHKGKWRDENVWRISAEHRLPLIGCVLDKISEMRPVEQSFLEIHGVDLMLSCFKTSDDSNEFILRFYEVEGNTGNSELVFNRFIESARLIDLIEHDIGELSHDENTIRIPVDAHSILSMKVKFRA
ncbi:MAG: alpha-mannosidase [Candidatus Thorarchaeota archaeon]